MSQVFDIITNLSCPRRCQHCVRGVGRDFFSDYELSIPDLENALTLTRQYKRVWPIVRLVGGDTLQWKYLNEGLMLLKENRDLFKILDTILSPRDEDIDRLLSVIDYFDVATLSVRQDNEKTCGLLKQQFPNKIRLSLRKTHYVFPTEPLQDVLPGKCRAPWLALFAGRIWMCPNFPFYYYKKHGVLDSQDSQQYNTSVEDAIKNLPKYACGNIEGYCDLCVDNTKTHSKLDSVPSV